MNQLTEKPIEGSIPIKANGHITGWKEPRGTIVGVICGHKAGCVSEGMTCTCGSIQNSYSLLEKYFHDKY